MKINILQGIEGSKQAKGLAVIIDVFRAFSVEPYLIQNGAKKIIPVGSKELAYALKEKDPSILLIGERHGKILPGFDYGNSPSQVKDVSFKGKTIVHTTSAGTQGIANAKNVDEIVTGSLVNAKAIAKYIQMKDPKEVSLVCMGLEGIEETQEDTLCAKYIQAILEGKEIDLKTQIEDLKRTSGAKFFDKKQRDVFPEEDFYLSTEVDRFSFVLKVENGEIKKLEM